MNASPALYQPSLPTPRSSALKAGWICLPLGFLTFWIFGFGFTFFTASVVCAVVAMCTNQVQSGIILLITSMASSALCVLLFIVFVLGSFGLVAGAAAEKVSRDMNRPQQQQRQFQRPVR